MRLALCSRGPGTPAPPAWPALLVLAVLLASATAGAAPARLGATFPPLPFLLPGQERVVAGNVTYSYDAPAVGATNVTITPVSGPGWLTARVEPAAAQLAASTPEGRTLLPVRLTVGVRAGTAALEMHTLQLRLEGDENPPLNATRATVGVPVRVGFVGALRVEAQPQALPGRPGEPLTIGIRVANDGNGPARVTFTPGDTPGLSLLVPGPLLVETRGQLQDRIVNVSALAQQPGRYEATLAYGSTHAFDHSLLGAAGEVRLTIEVGSTGLLPAPDPVLPLAIAAAAFAALRRRAGGLT